jgi:hypothetical protein
MTNYEYYVIARQKWLDAERAYTVVRDCANAADELRIKLHEEMRFKAACLNEAERKQAVQDQCGVR